MTLSYRHFERKREIFVICGQTANVRKCSNGKPVISDLRASPYLYSAVHFVILSGVKCRMLENVKVEL